MMAEFQLDDHDLLVGTPRTKTSPYRFSLRHVSESARKTFVARLQQVISEIEEEAYERGKADTQQAVREALGL